MKKVLLASTALVLAGGMAMAEVEVSGDGRMGIKQDIGSGDVGFTSRIRISFTGSGETDGGLTFGGSIRADNAGPTGSCELVDGAGRAPGDPLYDPATATTDCGAAGGGVGGAAGSVFAEGAFGRISMGDVGSAADAAVGGLSGIGLTDPTTGIAYIASGDTPEVLYEGSFGGASVYLGATNPADSDAISVGASYGFGNFTVALGYEDDGSDDHLIGGVSAGFGDATVKVVYGESDALSDGDQLGVSVDYVFGATTLSAIYLDNDGDEYGIGASYDLGGGASLKAGYVDSDIQGGDGYDFGMSMSF